MYVLGIFGSLSQLGTGGMLVESKYSNSYNVMGIGYIICSIVVIVIQMLFIIGNIKYKQASIPKTNSVKLALVTNFKWAYATCII